MTFRFPDIKKDETTNSIVIDFDKFRATGVQDNWTVAYQISYPNQLTYHWYYFDGNHDTNTKFENNQYQFLVYNDTNGQTHYPWEPNQRWDCRVIGGCENMLMRICAENGDILHEETIPCILENNSYRINIYPKTIYRGKVYIQFIGLDGDENTTSRLHIYIREEQIYNKGMYIKDLPKDKQTWVYQSCNKTGKVKIEQRIIVSTNNNILDANGNVLPGTEILGLEGQIISGLTYTDQKLTYVDYIPPAAEDPIDILVYLETQNNIPISETYNREILTYKWQNKLPNDKKEDFQLYEVFPYLGRDEYNNYRLIKIDHELNSQLEPYRVKTPVKTNSAGKAILNGFEGIVYSNYTSKPDISFGLPLPIDISQKDVYNIQTWDGSIAPAFSSGNGTKNNPYIINTPEEFARAVYRNNSAELYYEVNASCYAFNMNGMQNVDLYEHTLDANINIKWSPSLPFSGTINGNGIIIYNIYTNSGGLFPIVEGSVSIQGIILKHSHISKSESKDIDKDGVGGIIGYHTNEIANTNISNTRRINISKCAVIRTRIMHHNLSAALLGNSRWVTTQIESCCCYFNIFDYDKSQKPVSVGGFAAMFQSGSDATDGRVTISNSLIIGNNICPTGTQHMSNFAHWGYCWVQTEIIEPYITYYKWLKCDKTGKPINTDTDPDVQLNPNSRSYHFFNHMKFINCYADANHYEIQDPSPYITSSAVSVKTFGELNNPNYITSQLFTCYDKSILTENNRQLLSNLTVYNGDLHTTSFSYSAPNKQYTIYNGVPLIGYDSGHQTNYNQIRNEKKCLQYYLHYPIIEYKPIPEQNKYFNIDLRASDLGHGYSQAGDYIYMKIKGYHKDYAPENYYGSSQRYSGVLGKNVEIGTQTSDVQIKHAPITYIKPDGYYNYKTNKGEAYIKVDDEYKPIYKIYIKQKNGSYKEAF